MELKGVRNMILELFVSCILFASLCDGHMSLTYPPARKYALDFLDVVRTPAPCGGMPKGLGVVTELKANDVIDITWHLAYPHQGGYRLRLLDDRNRPVHNFTNGVEGRKDPTKLSHRAVIPNIACANCTIQLLREAREWWSGSCNNGVYAFYSCADVNIVLSSSLREPCSGHGIFRQGRCHCDKLWVGDTCQHKEECLEDSDCLHGGTCEQNVDTNYPKNHCYCSQGWFGRHCERGFSHRRSTAPSVADGDHRHTKMCTSHRPYGRRLLPTAPSIDDGRTLNAPNESSVSRLPRDLFRYTRTAAPGTDDYRIYHRILEDEIEVVLMVKTNTWVGFGWRPSELLSGCRLFPSLPYYHPHKPDSTAKPEGEGEPEGESTPKPEGEHTPKPEGEHTPKPEGEHTPKPEGEHTPKPEGEHTPKPEGEHTPKPEGEHTPKPEGEHTPKPEGEHTPKPEGEHTPKPEGEHTPKPEGEHTPKPEGEHTPKPEGEHTPKPEGEHTPNPEGEHTPKPEGEHTPKPEGEHTPNPEGEHTPNPEGEHTPKPEGEHTPKPEGEHTPKPEGEHTPNPEGEHTPNPEGEHTPNPEGEHTPKPEGEHTPNSEGEHTPNPEGEHTPKPEGEHTPKPEGEHTPNPEGEHTPKPEGEHTPKPEGEHTPKPEGEHTPKPEGEHTPKPEGEHTPKPEGEHTPNPEGEHTPKPEGEHTPKPEGEHTPNPEGEHTPKPEGEHTPNPEGEHTPKPEGEHTPKPEGEHTPKPEGEGEPEGESTPKPEGEGEPEGESTPKPEGEGEPEPEGNGNCGRPPSGSSPTTGVGLHPMDCSDVVIGTARGSRSRIGDYYTRDRSTPQFDSFYGGSESLTAAVGEEIGGWTTILFRRKLKAAAFDPADHSITDAAMKVLWARGQVEGDYHHDERSGLEAANTNLSLPAFYKHDQLKYHGEDRTRKYLHRGHFTLNFFEKRDEDDVVPCDGGWTAPSGVYSATWRVDRTSRTVTFTLSARLSATRQEWLAIGFNDKPQMEGPKSDAYIAWVDNQNNVQVSDRRLRSKGVPQVDSTQNARSITGSVQDGVTTVTFSRDWDTGDQDDFVFSNDSCAFMLFSWGGEVTLTGGLRKHNDLRSPSSQKFCFTKCDNNAANVTGKPLLLVVDITFKLRGITFIKQYSDPKTSDYQELAMDVRQLLEKTFHPLSGYRRNEILGFRNGSVFVDAAVTMERTGSVANDVKDGVKNDVTSALSSLIGGGGDGGFVFNSADGFQIGDPRDYGTDTGADDDDDDNDNKHTVTIIVIVIFAAGFLFLVLLATAAACRRYRTSCDASAINTGMGTVKTPEYCRWIGQEQEHTPHNGDSSSEKSSGTISYTEWKNSEKDAGKQNFTHIGEPAPSNGGVSGLYSGKVLIPPNGGVSKHNEAMATNEYSTLGVQQYSNNAYVSHDNGRPPSYNVVHVKYVPENERL